jgi:signal transduction histidine kinase/PAS domain-containing protein
MDVLRAHRWAIIGGTNRTPTQAAGATPIGYGYSEARLSPGVSHCRVDIMPLRELESCPDEVRRCVRGLVVLSNLSVVWLAHAPREIADAIAAALISVLDCEFVYVSLRGAPEYPVVETLRTSLAREADQTTQIRSALRRWLSAGSAEPSIEAFGVFGARPVRVVATPVGLISDSFIVVGALHEGFPAGADQLFIDIAANNAAMALQRWSAEASGRRFFELVARSSDFISLVSLEGRPVYINPSGLARLGLFEMKQTRGLLVSDFFDPMERGRFKKKILPTVLREGRWTGEVLFRHLGSATSIPFMLDAFCIDDPRRGEPLYFATVSRDLTGQKRTEVALRELNATLEHKVLEQSTALATANSRLKGEVEERQRTEVRSRELQSEILHSARVGTAWQTAAALAHELNQPLTAVTNSINALRRLLARQQPGDVDVAREVVEEAAGQIDRSSVIARGLHSFVRRGATEPQPERLERLIEEAVDSALKGTDRSRVRLTYRFEPRAEQVLVDRLQIQQVITNLVRNAVEATAVDASAEIVVSTTVASQPRAEVSVADKGGGIAGDIAGRLFRPVTSTKATGMGLGLSLCRSIVEAHGGKIAASPNPGGGTVLRFDLPLVLTKRTVDG